MRCAGNLHPLRCHTAETASRFLPDVVNWRPWIDTALDPPQEICEWNTAVLVMGGTYRAGLRSVVVLIADEEVNGCTA